MGYMLSFRTMDHGPCTAKSKRWPARAVESCWYGQLSLSNNWPTRTVRDDTNNVLYCPSYSAEKRHLDAWMISTTQSISEHRLRSKTDVQVS